MHRLNDQHRLTRSMAIVTVFAATTALADTINVPDEYATIQEAINVAGPGDEVLVQPGTYYEPIDLLGKAITVRALNRAADLPDPLDETQASIIDTRYDGRPSVVTCATDEGSDTIIDGFSLTQGRGTDVDGFYCGGGMFLLETSPTVVGCFIHYNVSCNRGGGIYSDGGSPAVSDCIFDNNRATTGTQLYLIGGEPSFSNCELRNYEFGVAVSLFDSSASISECSFTPIVDHASAVAVSGGSPALVNCTMQSHGGTAVTLANTSATISGCAFTANRCLGGAGAAIACIEASSPTIEGCTFTENFVWLTHQTGGGGAVLMRGGSGGTIRGCTFTANQADGGGGGAIACIEASNPTIENCTFEASEATDNSGAPGYGGAILCSESAPAIINCAFLNNHADQSGGAIQYAFGDSPTIAGCTFTDNHSDSSGGAVHSYGLASISLTDCTFQGNTAASEGGGARLEGYYACIVTLRRCTFVENTAGTFNGGGGLQSRPADTTLIDCTFTRNTCTGGRGGGVTLIDGGELMGCSFLGNRAGTYGGGLYFMGATRLSNCLFVGNQATDGGGIGAYVNPELTVINTTLTGNSATNTGQAISVTGGSTSMLSNLICRNGGVDEIVGPAAATYSDVEGGYDGMGNIDADPLFASAPSPGPDGLWGTDDDEYGDLRLQTGSPCIDAADCTAVPPDAHDLDGDGDTTEPIPLDFDWLPRFIDDPETEDSGVGSPCIDMGAYEYQAIPPCPADLDGNGVVDVSDLLMLLGNWGGSDIGDIDGSGVVDVGDLLLLLGAWGEC